MKNLIKNELFKLMHRTETLVLIIFAILVTIVLNFMDYYFSETNEKVYHKQLESEMKFMGELKQDATTIDDKVYYNTEYEISKLKLDYPLISPETGYINEEVYGLMEEMYRNQFTYGTDSENYLSSKKSYEEALQKLENYDWKNEIKKEISEKQALLDILTDSDEIGDFTKQESEYYQEVIRVLNYRLQNEIPVDGSNASNTLTEYLENLQNYQMFQENTLTHDEKLIKMELEEAIGIAKYKIDHDIVKEEKNTYATIAEKLIDIASGSGFMVMFVAIFIASMIIPTEFEKGTIKQLLVKPYTRAEILTSKILATILYFICFVIFFMLVNGIIVGIFAGFDTIKEPIVVYNFNTQTATQIGLLSQILKSFALVMPRFLVTIFIVNLFAIITKSTVSAMFVGLALNMVELAGLNKPIAKWILSNCWDFNVFANGRISPNQYVTLGSSIAVVAVTAAVALVLSYLLFKRKEIKNQ